jgi:predicted MFS family arabinose efflux permease
VETEQILQRAKRYESRLVVLFFCTWGTVFLQRMSVVYLAPFILPDLHLRHTQVGLLASALALSWAASGLVFGAVSDRVGRRPVLVPAIFLFSVFSWLSGLVQSFSQLFLVRTVMGIAGGPTWSTMTATIEESSEPKRRGRDIGIVVSAAALVGLALAPILATQIASQFGWRTAFFVAGIPGVVLGAAIWKVMKEPTGGAFGTEHHVKPSLRDYFSLLKYRNIWLCCVGAAGFMTWLFVMNVFAPLYITEVSKQSATLAGLVVGAGGLGAFMWGWIFPWVSDRTGRKPTLLFVALLSALAPLIFEVPFLVAHPWLLAAAGFLTNGGQGIGALVLVLVPTESVPAKLAGTAIGFSTLVGEVFGGAFAPTLAGSMADKYGLAAPLWIAAGGAILVFLASLFLSETAPAKVGLAKIT